MTQIPQGAVFKTIERMIKMIFNKINVYSLSIAFTETSINIDGHIKIIRDFNYNARIYIDEIEVFNMLYSPYRYLETNYYYKIPRSAVKKINKWSRDKIKQRKTNKVNEKKKIEQHLKNLYK